MANPLAPKAQTGASSFGLLLLRLALGVALCLHGWPKVQHIADWMNVFGMTDPAPGYLQAMAAVSEFAGGIAVAVGLLTPLAALGIACTMGYAVWFHISAGHAYLESGSGPAYELALVYLAAALCILFCGPGKLSLDGVMFKRD
ncbi:MAG: DoxX family protein [Planctomycetota bacterium]